MWLPIVLWVQIDQPGQRKINLWLPLVLLWALLFILLLLLLPLLLLAWCVLSRRMEPLRMIGQGYAVCCALRGLRINVRDGRENINIACW